MTSKELVEHMAEVFCTTASWPKYGSLDLHLFDDGGIEPLLDKISREVIKVCGDGLNAELQFTSMKAYREYAPCAQSDLDRLAQVADLFSKRANTEDPPPGESRPRITATEIGEYLGIEGLALKRLLIIIEHFGWRMQSGGTRGEIWENWAFSIPPSAIYFKDLSDYQSLEARLDQIKASEAKRNQREHWFQGMIPEDHIDDRKPHKDLAEDSITFPINLHESVNIASRSLLASGHNVEAVRKAAQAFEAYLHEIWGNDDIYGEKLAGKVLGGDNPVVAINSNQNSSDKNEQRGFNFFALGIMAALRNAYSHGHNDEISPDTAHDYLSIISAVWKRIDMAIGEEQ